MLLLVWMWKEKVLCFLLGKGVQSVLGWGKKGNTIVGLDYTLRHSQHLILCVQH